MSAVMMHAPYYESRATTATVTSGPATQDEIEDMDRIREMEAAKSVADDAYSKYQETLNAMLIERSKAAMALSDYLLSRPDVAKNVVLRGIVRLAGLDLNQLEAIRNNLPPLKNLA